MILKYCNRWDSNCTPKHAATLHTAYILSTAILFPTQQICQKTGLQVFLCLKAQCHTKGRKWLEVSGQGHAAGYPLYMMLGEPTGWCRYCGAQNVFAPNKYEILSLVVRSVA
jgi:hypothetical protein